MALIYFIGIMPLIIAWVIFPEQSHQAAVRGLLIWRDILLPALFPFFILSELLLGLGVVRLLGALLEPVMRPLFRLPGSAGFVMVLGFLAGYPVAAKLTAQLYRSAELTRSEAERLVGTATTADPIFIIGAVAVGLFHNQEIAIILLIAHYGASIILAFLQARFINKNTRMAVTKKLYERLREAWRSHKIFEKRGIWQVLYEAFEQSLMLVFMIGGLVVFFCVYISLLTSVQIMNYFYSIVYLLLSVISNDSVSLALALTNGLFEVTLGIRTAAEAHGAPTALQVAATGFILSWAGLSVHAQIMSLLQDSAVRYLPFAVSRVFHGIIASLIALCLWPVFNPT